MCVHVCVYRCMCICMYMYMCMSVYMYAYTFICARLWVYICTRVGAFCLFVLSNLSTTCACITGVLNTCMRVCGGIGSGVCFSLFMVSACYWRGRLCYVIMMKAFHGLAVEIPTNHSEIPGSIPGRYNLQIEITSKS